MCIWLLHVVHKMYVLHKYVLYMDNKVNCWFAQGYACQHLIHECDPLMAATEDSDLELAKAEVRVHRWPNLVPLVSTELKCFVTFP